MKYAAQRISLSNTDEADDSRLIKQGALTLFRLLRSAIEQVQELPDIVQQAAVDIGEAWEESASPKR